MAEVTTMSLSSSQERFCLFDRFGIYAPFFQTGDRHGGVEGLEASFCWRDGHENLCHYDFWSLGQYAGNRAETGNV
jgi:hypothetical protein